ncbi:hypothetical protein VTL71DRAFT_238 [Oculimacula yallundae]|uniref:Uncharacterized protein n=1 Tax=Oculimacula yallundae TaxID=86028 RepID=A0ABR4CZE6_9HELO
MSNDIIFEQSGVNCIVETSSDLTAGSGYKIFTIKSFGIIIEDPPPEPSTAVSESEYSPPTWAPEK